MATKRKTKAKSARKPGKKTAPTRAVKATRKPAKKSARHAPRKRAARRPNRAAKQTAPAAIPTKRSRRADGSADNGVDVAALLAAREALTAAPAGAKFTWRATCDWLNGTHARSAVDGFFGLGGEQAHRKRYAFESDHPEVFASEDNGATPVEMVLCGLAGCLTAGVASVAQRRNVQLHSVKATLEGSMDLQGILGIDGDVRNGFDDIVVSFEIDADASRDDIEAIVAQSQKRSAVYDIITNPTNVAVVVK